MIYPEAKFLPGGDRYVLVELGDEMNLELNFMAQGLAAAITATGMPFIIETAPCFASLLVHYDPDAIDLPDLTREVQTIIGQLGPSDDIELESRLFNLPAVYLDPWTRASVEDYCHRIGPKVPDPELVVQANELDDVRQLVRVHSASEYWVASLGFWPGLPFLMPLDPRCRLTAPKYNPPRTDTPQGAIGLGGGAHSIYPVATPGGYQIFGRTPVPIWDPSQRIEAFGGSLCLFRPGDRIKFVPVSVEEFKQTEAQVAEGRYVYNVVGYQKFSVAAYKRWVDSLNVRQRF